MNDNIGEKARWYHTYDSKKSSQKRSLLEWYLIIEDNYTRLDILIGFEMLQQCRFPTCYVSFHTHLLKKQFEHFQRMLMLYDDEDDDNDDDDYDDDDDDIKQMMTVLISKEYALEQVLRTIFGDIKWNGLSNRTTKSAFWPKVKRKNLNFAIIY